MAPAYKRVACQPDFNGCEATVGQQAQQSLGPFKSSCTFPSPVAPQCALWKHHAVFSQCSSTAGCWQTTDPSFEVYQSLTEAPRGLSDLQPTDTG